LFLPAAFVASVLAGYLGNVVASALTGRGWVVWTVSGLYSAAAFLWTGVEVAPADTGAATKWLVAGTLGALGGLSLVGGFVQGGSSQVSLAGGVMLLAAIVATFAPTTDLQRIATGAGVAAIVPPIAGLSWWIFYRPVVMPFYRWFTTGWSHAGGMFTHAWMIWIMGIIALLVVAAVVEGSKKLRRLWPGSS